MREGLIRSTNHAICGVQSTARTQDHRYRVGRPHLDRQLRTPNGSVVAPSREEIVSSDAFESSKGVLMPSPSNIRTFSDEQRMELFTLIEGADSVELKLTVPIADRPASLLQRGFGRHSRADHVRADSGSVAKST